MDNPELLDVIIVEPSNVQSLVLAKQLEALGVTAYRRVSTGQDALYEMEVRPPSLVISAYYLPDMSGKELVEAIREAAQLETIPFVLISSETRPQYLEGVRQQGVCGIIPKPAKLPQLSSVIETTLDLMGRMSEDADDFETANLHVLLVDDMPSSRKFFRHVLNLLGMENITEASNGQEAIRILETEMVDLLVTDYHMPEMDGKELTEFVRNQSWQRSVPILMVTGESNSARLAAVEDAGVSGICNKPLEPALIKSLLYRMIHETEEV